MIPAGAIGLRSLVSAAAILVTALGAAHPAGAATGETETVSQAMCRLIDAAAADQNLPTPFLARLIWRESHFRASAMSPAGAQGVAQFMPGTAAERGLADPFDPEQAIPHAARFVADLRRQFGNLGLAAAAYNGGPGRVSNWLAGKGGLPAETRAYVEGVTGRSVDEWAKPGEADQPAADHAPCVQIIARLQVPATPGGEPAPIIAPWGIQLSGSFSKSIALASFERARSRYAAVLGEVRPMIIGTRLLSRGTRAFYRVRVPSQTRDAANGLCGRIVKLGGACVVLRS